MVPVTLNVDMTPFEINEKIISAFLNTTFINGDASMLQNWRLLLRIAQGHGERQLLQPLQGGIGGALTFYDIY